MLIANPVTGALRSLAPYFDHFQYVHKLARHWHVLPMTVAEFASELAA